MCGNDLLPIRKLFFLIFVLITRSGQTIAMSIAMSSSKTIYGVPNSGWRAPQWNWGYAVGTGHECAFICRKRYNSRQARVELIKDLCAASVTKVELREPQNFEEVKLVLALAWQRGRWDGSDGGEGGYGEVLTAMAEASRYETDDDEVSSTRLVNDMTRRFRLLAPTTEQEQAMQSTASILETDFDAARRQCSGLVLAAMGFVDKGL